MPGEESASAWDMQLCLGQWQWTGKALRQPRKIQRGRRESKQTSEIPQGTRFGEAWRCSLWLGYAGLLAGIQKSGISSNRRRPKLTHWEKNSWGS